MTRVARNVIFDFGGVLVRWRPQEISNDFYDDEALRTALTREVFQHPDWLEMDKGALSEADAAIRFATRLTRPPEEMRALLQKVKESLTPMEETFAIARALHQQGVPLYGLSNMPASTFAYLRQRYAHWQVFKGIVISGEVRLMKPERAIFDHISRLYGLEPAATVFIDDHLANVAAASDLGFQTIHYTGAERCAAQLQQLLAIEVRPSAPQD